VSLQGLDKLQAEDRTKFYDLFKVSPSAARGFDELHPPLREEEETAQPTRKRRKQARSAVLECLVWLHAKG
jgi:hypothetical protein